MPKYYNVRIELEGIEPAIYRQILIDPDIKLSQFHKIIQSLFDWTNSHPHQFFASNTYYVNPRIVPIDSPNMINYGKLKLSDILYPRRKKIYYEYDFGDSWIHLITLKGVQELEEVFVVRCIGGQRNSPPEDCGGIFGFEEILTTLSRPNSDEYKELIEWLGEDYDPLYFDLEERNYFLRRFNKISAPKKTDKSK